MKKKNVVQYFTESFYTENSSVPNRSYTPDFLTFNKFNGVDSTMKAEFCKDSDKDPVLD